MAANTMIDYEAVSGADDINTMKQAVRALKKEYAIAGYNDSETNAEYERMLNLTTISLKMYATSYYKKTEFLESSDIDQIKAALHNYVNQDETLTEFKQELIGDLSEFQKKIKANHLQKLFVIAKQKQEYEKQVRAMEAEKSTLTANKVSTMLGLNKSKIKELDAKINAQKSQVKKCAMKIADLEQAHPTANEKDILLYQLSLKEKYAKKAKTLIY